MTILTRDGAGYRTELHTLAECREIAPGLAADPRHVRVAIRKSERARHPECCYYVQYFPSDPEVAVRLLQGERSMRRGRALREGDQYLWIPDPDAAIWHLQAVSGEHYTIHPGTWSCSCPDWERCGPNDVDCKHLQAYEMGLGTFLSVEDWDRRPAGITAAPVQAPAQAVAA